MAIELGYPPGSTPLNNDELDGLIPKHITTQGQLDAWEQNNILRGVVWAKRQHSDVLSEIFVRHLHKKMFDVTWSWAGKYRLGEKNIGVEFHTISSHIISLIDDVRFQIDHKSYCLDEIAARFHHRLLVIHPFPNGNGRHSRVMTDLLLSQWGESPFTWGNGDLISASETRKRYIAALQAADREDFSLMFAFVRG